MSTATKRIPVALSRDERLQVEKLARETRLPLATIVRLLVQRALSTIPDEAGGPAWLFAAAELEDAANAGDPDAADALAHQAAAISPTKPGKPAQKAAEGHSEGDAKAPLPEGRNVRARGGR